MPLKSGKDQETISQNIKELSNSQTKAGRERNSKPNANKINVAIAEKKARESK